MNDQKLVGWRSDQDVRHLTCPRCGSLVVAICCEYRVIEGTLLTMTARCEGCGATSRVEAIVK